VVKIDTPSCASAIADVASTSVIAVIRPIKKHRK
jgi:hypothetical protein